MPSLLNCCAIQPFSPKMPSNFFFRSSKISLIFDLIFPSLSEAVVHKLFTASRPRLKPSAILEPTSWVVDQALFNHWTTSLIFAPSLPAVSRAPSK